MILKLFLKISNKQQVTNFRNLFLVFNIRSLSISQIFLNSSTLITFLIFSKLKIFQILQKNKINHERYLITITK